jgi:hypothetical protein
MDADGMVKGWNSSTRSTSAMPSAQAIVLTTSMNSWAAPDFSGLARGASLAWLTVMQASGRADAAGEGWGLAAHFVRGKASMTTNAWA